MWKNPKAKGGSHRCKQTHTETGEEEATVSTPKVGEQR